MGPSLINRIKNSIFHGDYAGRDLNVTNIIMQDDSEREFVVTHNANIKPVSYFTGRETELKDLRQRIEEGRKSVLVSGMGGIGKTHICRKLFEEYLNRHAKDGNGPFQHIGYLEYNGDMDSSLQNCLKYKEQGSPGKNQEAAWRELEHLASDGKLLLFVDNVDKPISADPGLQRLKSIPGALVLTSRQVSISDEFEPYPIGFLDMERCKEIYEKIQFRGSERKVKPEEVSDLEYVIENLAGRHTITVEFLSHLAWTRHWSVKRLRKELEEKGFCLEFHKEGEIVNIQKSYEVLYDLSGLTWAEQNILEAFSIFPYIPLEAEICNQWLLVDAGVSEEDNVLFRLYQKGWLQFDWEQESYAMHPVFAQFIFEKCKPNAEKHTGLIQACQDYLKIPDNGSALECQKFIPFAESIVKKLNIDKEWKKVGLIGVLAYLLKYLGRYKEAEKLYNGLLEICREILGEENLVIATIYNNLALVYMSQGKYEKVEELCRKGLVIFEKVLGEEHPSTATSYSNLAGIYESQGEYEKAEELYQKSLVIREKVLGEEHPDTASSYNNLAYVYKSKGEYEKAIIYYLKAYKICVLKLGLKHPNTQIVYENMEMAYSEWNPEGNFERWLEEKLKEEA